MLILETTRVKNPSFWRADLSYAIKSADAAIGRIDLNAGANPDVAAEISIQEQTFQCRVHITAKPRWTYVPSRWVMYSGDAALHAATCESNKIFLVEGDERQESLRLVRGGLGASYTIERASDAARVCEMNWIQPRLLPTPRARGLSVETKMDLAVTFEVFLAWIAVQNDFRNTN